MATAVAATVGLVTRASSRLDLFHRTLQESARQGISLNQALSQPVEITHSDQGEMIHNILRFDYENARIAAGALAPRAAMVNTLQLLSFVIIPAVCVVLGVVVATRDYRYRTIKIRAAREGLGSLHAAHLIACLVQTMGALLAAMLASAVGAPVAAWAHRRSGGGGEVGSTPVAVPWSEVLTTLALTAAVTVFFCAVGVGLGLIFRKALVPALLFVVWNTMCPLLGAWDPRNLWLGIGRRTFTFEGVFTLATGGTVAVFSAACVLTALALATFTAGHALSSRTSRFAG